MFRVLTPIIRSSYNSKYSFWYWLTGSLPTAFVVELELIHLYRTVDNYRFELELIHVYRTVGTYRTIHMNQFQLNNESGW